MGDLSDNFSRSEFECKCGCGLDTVDTDLIRVLETVRTTFDRKVTITSAHRCRTHNASPAVRGGSRSQHLHGRAADIVVDGVSPELVYELVDQMGVGGAGKYDNFTHVDTRTNGPSRW